MDAGWLSAAAICILSFAPKQMEPAIDHALVVRLAALIGEEHFPIREIVVHLCVVNAAELKDIFRHHDCSVFVALGLPDHQLPHLQIHILHLEQPGLGGSQSAAIQKPEKYRDYQMTDRATIWADGAPIKGSKKCM